MKIFISVGEASGDLHAAELIRALRREQPDAEIAFMGGDLMAEAAGTRPLIHYREMAYMGFSEVLRHLPAILGNLRRVEAAIDAFGPDVVVLVDYPSFNLKLARHAKRCGMQPVYYISPKVWAWKEYRVRDIRRYVSDVLCILPFETDFYARHGMAVSYVGNPSVEEVDRKLREPAEPLRPTLAAAGEPLADDRRPLLAIVPGSRRSEIRNNLPVMLAVAARHPELRPVVAGAPGIEEDYYRTLTGADVVFGQTFTLVRQAAAALVTSGTATLEAALIGTPQVVCYRANGSRVSYALMSRVIKAPYVSLPNLIAGREIVPEMLLHHCNPDEVDARLREILPGAPGREAQLSGYAEMRRRLGTQHAAPTAARAIAERARAHAGSAAND